MKIEILSAVPNPFAIDHYHARKPFLVQADVVFRYGTHNLVVTRGYRFDGASIPRLLWSLSGLCPLDRETLFAACAHDWICDTPEELPRVTGDALFLGLLWEPIEFNGKLLPMKVSKFRAILMFLAVRMYSWWVVLTKGRI